MDGEPEAPISVVRWLFYAFVFSLPFETLGEGLLEPTTIIGGLLVASALFQPALFLRWPPKGFWCFIAYLYVFALLSATEPAEYRALTIQNVILLAQLTLLGWIGFCVLRHEKTAERALLTFAGGCAALSLLQVSGVVGRPVEADAVIVRFTAFGFHPNNLARILMLGLLALIGLSFGRGKSLVRSLLIAGPFVVLIGAALLQTGSRGALLALGIGLMTLVLRGGTFFSKALNGVGLLVLLGLLVLAALQSDVMRARFVNTIEAGDVARREEIYPNAWRMFLEKPIFGWGPIHSTYELGTRLAHIDEETKNPHNLFLFGLVSTGFLGALPLFIGIGFAIVSAWKSRRGAHSILPFTMVVAVMIANMSGLWLFNKLHWLVMGYAFASAYYSSLKDRQSQEVVDNQPQLSETYATI